MLLLLILSAAVNESTQPGCNLPSLNPRAVSKDGDIIIGGIFPVKIMNSLTENIFMEKPGHQSCERFILRAYRWVQVMIFAIEEINQNPKLLPNITLGYEIYDSCKQISRALEGTMWMITGQEEPIPNYRCKSHTPLAAIIGEALSEITTSVATLLGIYNYPQVSYFSTVDILSDRYQFPSFFRTIPNGNVRSHSLVQLLANFGWTWVGIIATDTEFGELSTQSLKKELGKTNACIGFSEIIPLIYSAKMINHVVDVIKRSSVNAIVIISSETYIVPLMEEVTKQNITGKIWVATETWSTSASFFKDDLAKTLTGTIGIATHKGDIPGFRNFLLKLHPFTSENNLYLENFWEHIFGCTWPKTSTNHTTALDELDEGVKLCTGAENLNELDIPFFDPSESRITYNVYNAVYAVAHALHDLYTCKPGEGPFYNGTCANIQHFEPWQLLHYVKNVHFKNALGDEVFFDDLGNPLALYDIVNWHLTPDGNLNYAVVGTIDFSASHGKNFIINSSALMWNGGYTEVPHSVCSESCPHGYRKVAQQGKPTCCFDCTQCSEGEISNQTDSTDCLKCPDDHWSNQRRDECIPKTIEFLSYEEPLGATLASISVASSLLPVTILSTFIKYRDTPIVKANNRELSYVLLLAMIFSFLCSLIFIGYPKRVTCMLRQAAFGIIFALCVSCVLAKTIMVVIAFNATKPSSNLKKWVGHKLPNTIVFVCTLLQVIICIAWLTSSPPFPEQNMKSQPGKIIIECNEGSTIAFWCVLGYMGLLATVSFTVAFLSRNLPDSFNEAMYITFSMLVFVSVWLAFIPAYLSTRGKYMVAVEIFAILASGAGLLSCIFFPKCYIILLRPDMNSKEYILGKGVFSNKPNK
ncbi:extracellular calcium-sensing receptor-like [Latimeria chalumnae]|uniref:extracellular calcium-sensing receptor-like n=1 Tax=Latimeria chalumnae TaxID=7897 RepID=UPI0006D92989|nr:PREDICTED: extracellular calcium-sensing receptor-like [Latimeria chalumnae]|eukprot:XP_006011179.2 PREDICTED: extracellular calcium-sensing receptor-like [Latimeria chalumnae]